MKFIKDYWHVIVTFLSVSIAYGILQSTVSAHEEKLRDIKDHGERIAKVEVAVAVLPEIQKDIKELLRRSK